MLRVGQRLNHCGTSIWIDLELLELKDPETTPELHTTVSNYDENDSDSLLDPKDPPILNE